MPLENGPVGSSAFKHNIKTEVKAGKPQKQAVAIAYREAGETRNDSSCDAAQGYMDAVLSGNSARILGHFRK